MTDEFRERLLAIPDDQGSVTEHTMLCAGGFTSCDERHHETAPPPAPRHRADRGAVDPAPPPLMNWRNWIILVIGVTLIWASAILLSARANAAEVRPVDCAWVTQTSGAADWCRDQGWRVTLWVAVNPHGVVKRTYLPPCTVEDGSSGPLPCSWNFPGAHQGNGLGLAYWISNHHHIHYVWTGRPTPISEGYAHWARPWAQYHLGLNRHCWVYRTKQGTWNSQCPDTYAPFI